jgi:hypothetical protein
LNQRSSRHDGGAVYRQAWFDSSRDVFVCSVSGNPLANVVGWALASTEDE